jgi:hypothetical protein
MVIQDVGVKRTGIKPLIPPTNRQNNPPEKITDIRYIHR